MVKNFAFRLRFNINFHRFLKRITGRGCCLTREFWEISWRNGGWDYLKQVDQLAHYSIIASYFKYFKQRGSILDVGCGDGLLQERLYPDSYSKYVGVDFSSEAIKRACDKQDEKVLFAREDAENYVPFELFDAIVFNESLYYFDNPLKTLKRYSLYLKPCGIFIISMCSNKDANYSWKWIWKKLESAYVPLDAAIVTNRSGGSWICKVFQP